MPPIYEYECQKCGKIQEIRHSADTLAKKRTHQTLPPFCGGKLKLIISKIGGFVFKGPGFFQTDYKNRG